jgi:hypothetical protein
LTAILGRRPAETVVLGAAYGVADEPILINTRRRSPI